MHGPVTVIPDSGGLGAHGRPLALGLCPSGVALGRADPGYEPSPPGAGLLWPSAPGAPEPTWESRFSGRMSESEFLTSAPMSQELRGTGLRPGPFPAQGPPEPGTATHSTGCCPGPQPAAPRGGGGQD